jgi:hypothetical protein
MHSGHGVTFVLKINKWLSNDPTVVLDTHMYGWQLLEPHILLPSIFGSCLAKYVVVVAKEVNILLFLWTQRFYTHECLGVEVGKNG